MAFFGCQFVFDDIPSWEYGLVCYDISTPTEDGIFSSTPTDIYEDRTPRRYTPMHYGVSRNTPLTFSFTFGADPRNIHKGEWLDRHEMDAIASWLTKDETYKYLEIIQPDLDSTRYRCIITNLKYSTYGKFPWAFTCEVTCDSPYAYLHPETFSYSVNGTLTTIFDNKASSDIYRPKLHIIINRGNTLSIINHSDNDRAFIFSSITGLPIEIDVDNENEIITNNKNINLYDKFNFKFFRLIRGRNNLEFTVSNATVNFLCEFPINVGG